MSSPRQYDLIVFGATSFVGKIIAQFLVYHYPQSEQFKWAIAGRSEKKLKTLLAQLPADKQAPDWLIADSTDSEQVSKMCAATRVLISTVGPYALYGDSIVEACVAAGTDYLDLCGEPHWIHRMQHTYRDKAQASGARILHCCGFDSVPSDLGVYFLQQESQKQFGRVCTQVAMRVRRLRGGASGGTIFSMMNLIAEASHSPALRKALANPYLLCPSEHHFRARQKNLNKACYDPISQSWIAPFVMAAINTRVVHQSNALLNDMYSENFLYEEAMMTGKGWRGMSRGWMIALGLGGLMLAAGIKPLRHLLTKYWLPKPGEGPSVKAQKAGFYELLFYGHTEKNERLCIRVMGDRDPGYGSTAKIISECAIALVNESQDNKKPGGFYTPAAFFGSSMFTRLGSHAGLSFDIVPEEPGTK